MEIKLFSKWRPSLNFWKLLFWSFDMCCTCDSTSAVQISHNSAIMAPKYRRKKFQYGVWQPSWICKISIFLSNVPSSEWKFASANEIRSKSVNSRLKSIDKAIFKMAAVRHLEFAKIAVLITWPISAFDSSSPSKFRVNRPIYCQNLANFSIWYPSAILNLRKLPFWSLDLCLHVILHLWSKLRINRPIWRRDIAKNRLSIWRLPAILNLLWRNYIASENYILCSQLCVKFSRRSVAYILKYLVFHVSAF